MTFRLLTNINLSCWQADDCGILKEFYLPYMRHYKVRILGSKIEEFPRSVHKLSVILTALQYKPQWKMG